MDSTTSGPDRTAIPAVELVPSLKRMGRLNRWDTPWFNAKLLTGVGIIGTILLIGILGRYFWDTDLAYAATSPPNLPPVGFEYKTSIGREFAGTWDHPLGTENSGRDMLALMIMAAPNSFLVGVIAAGVGMSVGIILGFSAGFLGGRVDDFIRLMSDVTVTIPALMVLIVIQSLLTQIELITMALLIALFAWPSPTRLIRAQVLSMRESGYVRMAKLSGASSFDIMFREMLPICCRISPQVLSATQRERSWPLSVWKCWGWGHSAYRRSAGRSTLHWARPLCCAICGGGGACLPSFWRSCLLDYCSSTWVLMKLPIHACANRLNKRNHDGKFYGQAK